MKETTFFDLEMDSLGSCVSMSKISSIFVPDNAMFS